MTKIIAMKTIFTTCLILLSLFIQAQHEWVRTNPGGGGAIAVVGATVDGTILAASDLSGIYRSNDNGQSWDVVGANQGLEETHISAFGFDPTDGDVFFAGTYVGLYKTTDGGENFSFVFPTENNDTEYSYIEDVAISAFNASIGYVTHHPGPETSGDVYKTIDGGNSWNPISGENLPDDLHIVKLMVHPTSADIVYALSGKSRWGCGDANLYRSIDGGVNWVIIGDSEGDILDFDLHTTDPEIIFVSTFETNYQNNTQCLELNDYISENENQGELYKSTNGGTTFTQIGEYSGIISVGIDNPDVIRVMDVLYPYDWNDNAGTWETTNGGTSWSHTGLMDSWFGGYTENQYYVYTASYNGFTKTISKDIFNSDRIYGSYGQWAWGSFDGGVTFDNISTQEVSTDHWISTGVENLNGHCLDINESNPDVVYVGTWDVGFWVSRDNGDSWTRFQPNYNIYPEYSWTLGDIPVSESEAKHGAGGNVATLLNDPDRENVVWATFSHGQLTDPIENSIAKTGLFKSVNYGEDWVLVSEGLPSFDNMIRVYGLALDVNSPTESRTLYITVDGNVYRSSNDGESWQMVLTNGHLKFTEVDKFDGNIVFAGGKDGLWRSLDAGDTWVDIGIPEMHSYHANTRPDIVPTWTDWSGDEPTYSFEGVFDIQTDPNITNRVYLTVKGPDKGLYVSNDAGDTWLNILVDSDMRSMAISPANSDVIYATSSMAYHSGGFGNSLGIVYSTDAGLTWSDANDGMAYSYGGMIEVETGENPYVWAWSPGTGVQKAAVPFFIASIEEENDVSNLLVYPNPVQDLLMLDLSSIDGEVQKIEIYSSLGELVYSQDIITMYSQYTIDVSEWKQGGYLVKMFHKETVFYSVFVKNNY